MPLLDILLAASLVLAAYLGYRSGAATKAFTLVSILVSVFLAGRISSPFGRWLIASGITSASSAQVIAFLLVLAIVMVVLFMVFRRLARLPLFRAGRQVFGLLLGLVEGLLLLSALLWVLKGFDEPGSKLRSQSSLYRPVVSVAPAVVDLAKSAVPGATELRQMLNRIISGDGTKP